MPIDKPLEAIFFHDFANSHIPEIFEETYIKQVYKPFLIGRRDLVIADWGANIGMTSYYFKDYAKIVYAVEPSKLHLKALNSLVEFNQIKNIKICPYAISSENGTTKFYHNDNVTMFSMENTVNNKDDFEEVETVDVGTFLSREGIKHIDLLKFDCEGSESKIITSEAFKKAAPKIQVIVGEYHAWTEMGKELFCNTFRDLGFEFKWLPNTVASVFTAVRI